MLACQRELGLRGMVELGAEPVRGGVALRAILREAGGHVIGIIGALHILQVARAASSAERGEIVVGVASGAKYRGMRARQREGRRVVIEARSGPVNGAVAERAVLGESGGHMVRI